MTAILKCIQDRIFKLYGEEIPMELIDEITKYGQRKDFSKGDIIVSLGQENDKLYFMIKGIARSFYLDQDGNDVTKYFMEDFCGGESLIVDGKSEQCIEALEDVETIVIDAKVFKKLLLSNEQLTRLYIHELEECLIYKMKREGSFLMKSATERYLELKKQYPTLENRVSQKDIASYLGISPVSLSRIRRTIREEN